uniref:Coatomer subunit epsilon n=1 Tax=Rhabditophanes sp. KR3021 TaxID=114890 RepID=A0AC35U0H9_9BILA
MENDRNIRSEVFYNFREKYYGTALNICEEYLLHATSNKVFFLIAKSYCLVKLKRTASALRQLNSLKDDQQFKVSLLLVNKIALEAETEKDLNRIKEVSKEIENLFNKATEEDVYTGCIVLISENQLPKAKTFIQRNVKDDTNQDISCLLGALNFQ